MYSYEAKRIGLHFYEKSESFDCQGTYASIQGHLKRGFMIDKNKSRNGYWRLFKPVKAWIVIDCGENGTYCLDMSYGIKLHYDESRISESLVNRFICDFQNGKVRVFTDGKTYKIQ